MKQVSLPVSDLEGSNVKGSSKRKPSAEKRSGANTSGNSNETRCLFRATDGKKRKISCLIAPGEHVRFQMELLTVVRASTDTLKRKQKAKKVKSTARV
eukprot:CAMPEP_0185845238 /NCGR_PEP_ID=MMETSP1354-20130828/1258_1 /TAXON_ID=708628 /ORGANISM="Erythrolobus madagascarensis, Strain CCMP3276" /LENGTH=97 /DNA_ID=CAMNT_0028545153 /DNA_START=331 /DNA_END=624 /DNA_ORIENTATION=-